MRFKVNPHMRPCWCVGPCQNAGLMGWRVGYIAYPAADPQLGQQLLKVQVRVPGTLKCSSVDPPHY